MWRSPPHRPCCSTATAAEGRGNWQFRPPGWIRSCPSCCRWTPDVPMHMQPTAANPSLTITCHRRSHTNAITTTRWRLMVPLTLTQTDTVPGCCAKRMQKQTHATHLKRQDCKAGGVPGDFEVDDNLDGTMLKESQSWATPGRMHERLHNVGRARR